MAMVQRSFHPEGAKGGQVANRRGSDGFKSNDLEDGEEGQRMIRKTDSMDLRRKGKGRG
jgi:hypothetical protein